MTKAKIIIKNSINLLEKIAFVLSIFVVIFSLYTLTISQCSVYEFADWQTRDNLFYFFYHGFPIALIILLLSFFKKIKLYIIIKFIIAIAIYIVSHFFIGVLVFIVGMVTITNDEVLFKQKSNTNITIMSQTIGQGAYGEDGHRIVKLEPFLYFWNKVTIIDTSKINKAEWIPVNKKSSK